MSPDKARHRGALVTDHFELTGHIGVMETTQRNESLARTLGQGVDKLDGAARGLPVAFGHFRVLVNEGTLLE